MVGIDQRGFSQVRSNRFQLCWRGCLHALVYQLFETLLSLLVGSHPYREGGIELLLLSRGWSRAADHSNAVNDDVAHIHHGVVDIVLLIETSIELAVLLQLLLPLFDLLELHLEFLLYWVIRWSVLKASTSYLVGSRKPSDMGIWRTGEEGFLFSQGRVESWFDQGLPLYGNDLWLLDLHLRILVQVSIGVSCDRGLVFGMLPGMMTPTLFLCFDWGLRLRPGMELLLLFGRVERCELECILLFVCRFVEYWPLSSVLMDYAW